MTTAFDANNHLQRMLSNMNVTNQLKTAVACNMVGLLDRVLASGVDVNGKTYEHHCTALHLAANRGYHECVKKLLKAGANPDETNDPGFTPLALALRHGHIRCVRLLFETGSLLSDPRMIWMNHNSLEGVPVWSEFTTGMMTLLLIATPDLSGLGPSVLNNMWEFQLKTLHSVPLIRMFVLTGNRLTQDQMDQLVCRADSDVAASLRSLQAVKSLQHYARVAIRKQLRPNTLWAAQNLPLPAKLQTYLIFDEDSYP